jgi:anhydro-N-acetylmuramic acid kinase
MSRKSRLILGLNSGTSADGIDAVACEITGRGLGMGVRVLDHLRRGYEPELRQRILASMAPAEGRTEGLCELDTDVGRAFARTAAAAVKKLGLKGVDLIGSHGQTICHLPPGGALQSKPRRGRSGKARRSAGTMQIGNPAIIATRLRAPVVSHFRQADMAVGGQGAPLTPWTDYVLFRHPRRNRVIQNIGGIANLTWLPAGRGVDQVVAFDTGPGNMVIDALVRRFTRGREHFDRHGRRAALGRPDAVVLKHLLAHPFLARMPPKSCGREDFGEAWVQQVLKSHARRRLHPDDWIATATALTAASIAGAYKRFFPAGKSRRPRVDEVFVCGGGARNHSLLSILAGHIAYEVGVNVEDLTICTTADLGIMPQAKEAVSFAMLAAACVDGVSANLPRVTGARRRVVLGQVCDPEPRT